MHKTPAPPSGVPARGATRSAIEEQLFRDIGLCKLPPPVRQLRPFPDRRYRLDFAYPQWKLAVEVDGAVHRIKGRFKASFERGFWLMRAGWKVLHVGGDEVRSGQAIAWLEELIEQEKDREEIRRKVG